MSSPSPSAPQVFAGPLTYEQAAEAARARDAPAPESLWRRERRRIGLWAPAGLGLGIWLWFVAPAEPPAWTALGALLAFWGMLGARALGSWRGALILGALLTVSLGWSAALLRARIVAAPIIDQRDTVEIEGRLRAVEFRTAGGRAFILDDLTIGERAPDRTPRRIRANYDGDLRPQAGERLKMTAFLQPPPGAAFPGGHDYARGVWFEGIGAVGRVRAETLEILPPRPGDLDLAARLSRWRASVGEALVERMGPRTGGVAAALSVGVRGLATPEVEAALRDSGLTHLLSISGAHMAVMSALIFGAARALFAAIPGLAARRPIKKWAALTALLAATLYLAASGADAPAQRAYVMSGTALLAVLLDRRAISFRSLAAAAAIILILRPESLMEAGFQMSFAATAALVAAFEAVPLGRWLAGRPEEGAARRWGRRLLIATAGSVLVSLAAGLASGIYGAAHFNRIQAYALPANLAASPLSSLLIMPALAATAVLAVLGLEAPALWALHWGVEALNRMAELFAGLPGAAPVLPSPPDLALALASFGGIWLCFWRDGRLRLAGAAPLALGLALWGGGPKPDLLIARDGDLLALRGADGLLALSDPKRDAYSAETWLRREGDSAGREAAAARTGWRCSKNACEAEAPEGWRVIARFDKPEPQELAALCAPKTLLVTARIWGRLRGAASGPAGEDSPPEAGATQAGSPPATETMAGENPQEAAPPAAMAQESGGCLQIEALRLRREGALAVSFTPQGPEIAPSRAFARIWTRSKPE